MAASLITAKTGVYDRFRRDQQLLGLMDALKDDLEKVARDLIAGRVTSTGAVQAADKVFTLRHNQAAVLGFKLAAAQNKMVNPLMAFPASIGHRVAQSQNPFFRSLRTDILEGRYEEEDGKRSAALDARLQLYANRLAGTANESWADAMQKSGVLVLWVLGENEEHCGDCLFESKQGWRNPGMLKRYPGDGSTICVTNCRCALTTKGGVASFKVRQ